MSTALAIFVKTPGHSPLKTRLAATIGVPAATAFHRLAARAVAESAQVARARDPALHAYWAVAERTALDAPPWRNLLRLWQGEGGLGERMHRIYAALLARHERVLLVGADTPQLTVELLLQARAALTDPAVSYVIGKARDGGFWLFGGRVPITREIWCGVRYSCPDTARQFCGLLDPPGTIAVLPTLTDVDEAADLDDLQDALAALSQPSPAQRELLYWLTARHTACGAI